MPDRLSLQLSDAEEQLRRINEVTSAAQQELGELQEAIRVTRRDHDREVAALRRSFKKKQLSLEKEYAQKAQAFRSRIESSERRVKELSIQEGVSLHNLDEQTRKLELVQEDYRTTKVERSEKLTELRLQAESTITILTDKQAELSTINQKIEQDGQKLTHVEERLVQAEQAFTTRSDELRTKIREAEDRLEKTQRLIKEYETSAEAIRKQDEARGEELYRRETALTAGRRALGQDRQNFESVKRRFYQTKSL
jgi:chromosome segregation ATPase